MLNNHEAEARAAALVERAKRAGADAADALYLPMPRPRCRCGSASSRMSPATRRRISRYDWFVGQPLGERFLVRSFGRGPDRPGRASGGDGPRGAGGSLVRPRPRGLSDAGAGPRRRRRRRRGSVADRAQAPRWQWRRPGASVAGHHQQRRRGRERRTDGCSLSPPATASAAPIRPPAIRLRSA